jgi:hypothetical protein
MEKQKAPVSQELFGEYGKALFSLRPALSSTPELTRLRVGKG